MLLFLPAWRRRFGLVCIQWAIGLAALKAGLVQAAIKVPRDKMEHNNALEYANWAAFNEKFCSMKLKIGSSY